MRTGNRCSRGILVLMALAGLSVGALASAMVKVAKAYHYHQICNEHGMVHGDSTSDSIYHGRWRDGPCTEHLNVMLGLLPAAWPCRCVIRGLARLLVICAFGLLLTGVAACGVPGEAGSSAGTFDAAGRAR